MSGITPTTPSFPRVPDDRVAWITTDQMREIDDAMVDGLGIVLLQMMENAGRHLADVTRAFGSPSSVQVCVGPGGNGGGGLVAARHLANLGVEVTVSLAQDPLRMSEVARHQLAIVERLGLRVEHYPDRPSRSADVAIDALIGYGLTRPLTGAIASLAAATRSADRIVSLDVPTGVDSSTGQRVAGAVRPDLTVTLCLPKLGLADRGLVGELLLADISVPPALTEQVGGRPAPPFELGPILYLDPEFGS